MRWRSAREALDAGFDAFIPKPISPESFVSEIQRFLKPELIHNIPPLPTVDDSSAVRERWAGQQHTGTILVVDDRPVNLELGRSMLEPFGFKVVTAGGVQEALASARQEPPSLILTDVHMGDGTGFDLVKTVRTDPELQKIPCILTSVTYLDVDPRVTELGLDDSNFLLRPVTPEILVEKIEACLAAARRGN